MTLNLQHSRITHHTQSLFSHGEKLLSYVFSKEWNSNDEHITELGQQLHAPQSWMPCYLTRHSSVDDASLSKESKRIHPRFAEWCSIGNIITSFTNSSSRAKREFFFQNLTLGYMTKTLNQNIFFFLHQNQNIFFSNIGNQNILLEKNQSCPLYTGLKYSHCSWMVEVRMSFIDSDFM
jgi:hypothetical protein